MLRASLLLLASLVLPPQIWALDFNPRVPDINPVVEGFCLEAAKPELPQGSKLCLEAKCIQNQWKVVLKSEARNGPIDTDEICDDELDNNCNGYIDEGCLVCQGLEVCDGFDNDCDRLIDEGCDTGGNPAPEVCDGFDNDLDGLVDEGCQECRSEPEVCDRQDNDCDYVVDNGCTDTSLFTVYGNTIYGICKNKSQSGITVMQNEQLVCKLTHGIAPHTSCSANGERRICTVINQVKECLECPYEDAYRCQEDYITYLKNHGVLYYDSVPRYFWYEDDCPSCPEEDLNRPCFQTREQQFGCTKCAEGQLYCDLQADSCLPQCEENQAICFSLNTLIKEIAHATKKSKQLIMSSRSNQNVNQLIGLLSNIENLTSLTNKLVATSSSTGGRICAACNDTSSFNTCLDELVTQFESTAELTADETALILTALEQSFFDTKAIKPMNFLQLTALGSCNGVPVAEENGEESNSGAQNSDEADAANSDAEEALTMDEAEEFAAEQDGAPASGGCSLISFNPNLR